MPAPMCRSQVHTSPQRGGEVMVTVPSGNSTHDSSSLPLNFVGGARAESCAGIRPCIERRIPDRGLIRVQRAEQYPSVLQNARYSVALYPVEAGRLGHGRPGIRQRIEDLAERRVVPR
jgi:hypothetical protein